jgi:Cof subfamily protein (haloacid dehalogenase superfamily)
LTDNSYRLLVVDIDGTLVNRYGTISDEDREAMFRVRQAGMQVALSTGRGLQATMNIINELSLDSYHISFDGALVSHPSNSEEIYVSPIAKELVRQMIDVAHRCRVDLELFTVTHYFVERETWSTGAHRDFFGVNPTVVDLRQIWQRERILKGGVVPTTAEEKARAADFCSQLDHRWHLSRAITPAYPGVDFFNILAPGVSKGKALEKLAAHLNIPLRETIAVGDGTNDVSLLKTAGLAIAMGNAADEVKAVADYVTLDVDHSGLAAAMKTFL